MVKASKRLKTSEFVSKDLTTIKKKEKRVTKKVAAALEIIQQAKLKEKLRKEGEIELEDKRRSDDPKPRKRAWKNKQRMLVFASRGISFQGRHLMENIRRLLPHTKKESKLENKDALFQINEIAEMKNCNKCLFFESRKAGDVYVWMVNIGDGPSVKLLMENASTMEELKFSGNCLKGSRAILSFDPTFDSAPHLQLMKELFIQTFGTPYHYPKSQPFIDHVFTFTYLDNRIWFRNFQIMEEDGSIVEIGPRFILNPIKIFDGSFSGVTIWSNPHFVTPGKRRSELKKALAGKYVNKLHQKIEFDRSKPKKPYVKPADHLFREILGAN